MTAHRHLFLASPEQTCALAARLGAVLAPGDALLLEGPIGAGKTHFARCLIQSILSVPEDVPSPTFTLVQTYETEAGPLWHADLYRLGDADQVVELGLAEAFDTAICLVEWPDRLAGMAPDTALHLAFQPDPTDPEARSLTLSWTAGDWAARLEGVLA